MSRRASASSMASVVSMQVWGMAVPGLVLLGGAGDGEALRPQHTPRRPGPLQLSPRRQRRRVPRPRPALTLPVSAVTSHKQIQPARPPSASEPANSPVETHERNRLRWIPSPSTPRSTECSHDQRADVAPLEAALAAAERRDRDGVDLPFLDDLTQAGQASLDVTQPPGRARQQCTSRRPYPSEGCTSRASQPASDRERL
jgi:hypothetical protein